MAGLGSASLQRELRKLLSQGLSDPRNAKRLSRYLVPMRQAELFLPTAIGAYSDFYTGIHHAVAVGKIFRPDNPLLPNYQWVPIGYHGRASSVVVSGTPVTRPNGQTKAPDAAAPLFGPFVGTTQTSDFSPAWMSGLWPMPFPNPSTTAADFTVLADTDEISQFLCRELLCVLRVYDRAGPAEDSRGALVGVAFRFA